MSNRLSRELSPYLRQHAENPVDWFPWCDEAFEQARRQDKPVFLSIGYSSCHWCHVMAHESFENPAIARFLNQHFISIKVDREERPDIDFIYMQAVQAFSGSGGWPLSVFLTPDRKPFAGGTYFPPEDRYRRPGFLRVLEAVRLAYRDQRSNLVKIGQHLEGLLTGNTTPLSETPVFSENILKLAYQALEAEYDSYHGGFGPAPKFPHPMTLEYLLRYYLRFKEPAALEMASLSLQKMAAGGIYDQIGGGFHRYSTDEQWLVPHFEKMLYDNALLSRVYLNAYRLTGKKEYAAVACQTLDYILREMRSSEGGFFSSQDADSEGQEGQYYLWQAEEIQQIIGMERYVAVFRHFGIKPEGNFEGKNILSLSAPVLDRDELQAAKTRLFQEREKRIKPARDEKIIAAWNGLVLIAMAEAAAVLNRPEYLEAAKAGATFIEQRLWQGNRLNRVYNSGVSAVEAFLEDYAAVIEGFLAVHQATLESRWLVTAVDLCQTMFKLFKDDSGLLFDTHQGVSDLFVRPRNSGDGATPSGISLAVGVLLKMSSITGRQDYRAVAEKNMFREKEALIRFPLGYSYWLHCLDFYLSEPWQVIIAGEPNNNQTRQLAEVVKASWHPNLLFLIMQPGEYPNLDGLPLFSQKSQVNGNPAAYVCRNYACRLPVSDATNLKNELTGNR